MSRLVQENTWYKKENENLRHMLSSNEEQDIATKKRLLELEKERRGAIEERKALRRYLKVNREEKINLEYQSRHIG